MRGRSLEQCDVGVDGGDGSHSVVDHSVSNVDPSVRAAQRLMEDFVHLLGGTLVVGAQQGEEFEQLDLDPWRRYAVVIKGRWKSMLIDLLEDRHKRGHQIFV